MEVANGFHEIKNDLTGREFGLLRVIEVAPRERYTNGVAKPLSWKCKCICGSYVTVRQHNLLSGATRSCGCVQKKYFKSIGRQSNLSKGYCPYPCAKCSENSAGKCCSECDKAIGCEYACKNLPSKCGRDKNKEVMADD